MSTNANSGVKNEKNKYQKDFEIFGTGNSYSKTDQDATFMRMKDDYEKWSIKAWL